MSGKSPIQWTDASWNPVVGCKRVSAGCDHCYAFQLHDQRHIAWKRGRFPTAPRQYHVPFSQVQLLPERLSDPLHWRKPRRVFVNSMSDLFHEDVSGEFIRQVFMVMGEARQHTFQVLTKRPERMRNIVSAMLAEGDFATLTGSTEPPFPWPNIWLGVSVENHAAAEERIPLLLETPAAVRFLSCEPLLGPFSLLNYWREAGGGCWETWLDGLDWVILGGESGPHARPLDLAWVTRLIQECQAKDVPVFVKQLGSQLAYRFSLKDRHGGNMEEWPPDYPELCVREYPQDEERGGA